MRFKVTMPVFLHMVRRDRENLTQLWGMAKTKASYRGHVRRFSSV